MRRKACDGLAIQYRIKAVLDFLVASFALLGALPSFGIIALSIKLTSSGPVFFTQERVGRSGKAFQFIKFRTMIQGAEHIGLGLSVAENDPRITPVGRVLRDISLDELPQLINVLKGEMSLVGPRPTVPSQVSRYTAYQWRRLEVKPGITGWAQINGRNNLSWAERIDLDVWYVDHWRLALDFRILARTFGTVVRREGLYGRQGITENFR